MISTRRLQLETSPFFICNQLSKNELSSPLYVHTISYAKFHIESQKTKSLNPYHS